MVSLDVDVELWSSSGRTHRVGGLDGRPVGNGVGERHAELNDVGAALLHGKNDIRGGIGRRESGGHIGDERSLMEFLLATVELWRCWAPMRRDEMAGQ